MKRTRLLLLGKTKQNYVQEGIDFYAKRIDPFTQFEMILIKEGGQKKSIRERQKKETRTVMDAVGPSEALILLDEKGRLYDSIKFAEQLTQWTLEYQSVNFAIGGAYGWDAALRTKATSLLSLSPMTFPHDLVRVIFLEQLYRAFSIMNNKKYHHI